MIAHLCNANSAVSLIKRIEQKRLASRVLKRVFKPSLADRLGGNEAAKRKLLCNEHTFDWTDTVRENEDAVTVNKVGLGEEIQSCQGTPYCQMEVGLRAVTWRTLAQTLTILFHSQGDKTSPGQAIEQTSVSVIRF